MSTPYRIGEHQRPRNHTEKFFQRSHLELCLLEEGAFGLSMPTLPGHTDLFPQHLVEGLRNFRRRVCRAFWLDLAFQDPPRKTDQ